MTKPTNAITTAQRDFIIAEFEEKAARVQALMATPLTGVLDVMVAWGEVPSHKFRNAQLCHVALRTILQAADPVRYGELLPSFLDNRIGQGWPYPSAGQVLDHARVIVMDPASFDLSRTFQGHASLSEGEYGKSVAILQRLLEQGVNPGRVSAPTPA